MDVINQKITDRYALYNSDCMRVMEKFPDASFGGSIYSPPFAGLYNYSSSDHDHSNVPDKDFFLMQYECVIREIARLTKPGRMTMVHCMDVAETGNKLWDFPGEIIRLHEKNGFSFFDRKLIWKEPLRVAMRTRTQGLQHKWIVKDSSRTRVALADQVLIFRRAGENKEPIVHPEGLSRYAGDDPPPVEVYHKYKNHKDPKTNKWSHYIFQKYASAFWYDIRIDEVLEYRKAKHPDDEKHVHPLQLDVIDRCLTLYTNKGDKVLTPYMGVGSEVYGAVSLGRVGVGVELKESYYRQAVENMIDVKSRFSEDAQLTMGLYT